MLLRDESQILYFDDDTHLNCQQRRMMLAAYRAFAKQGGTRADFKGMWPLVYAEATVEYFNKT